MNAGLKKLLLNTIVRIETPSQVGTGFFIYPGMLVTCAHVVWDEDQVANTIDISFEGKKYKATVQGINQDSYVDVAILQIECTNHHCLQLNHGKLFLGNAYFAQGFQKVDKNDFEFKRDTTTLKYEGPVNEGPQELLKFKEGQIINGISGAPVLDAQGQVYGVMKATRDKHTDLGGEAIPIAKLVSVLKSLNLDWLLQTVDHQTRLKATYRKYIFRFDQLKKRIPKYVLLTSIIGLLILWLINHLGFTYGTPISLTLGIIGFLLANDRDESFQQELKLFKGLTSQRMLSNLLIFLLGILTCCLWLLVGSVSIQANDIEQDEKVTFYHQYKPDASTTGYLVAPSGELRFNKLISPFGEPYVIEIAGYDPKPVELSIGLGTKLTFPTHFSKEPVLYVRLPYRYSQYPLIDSCWISIISSKDTIKISTLKGKGGILVGSDKMDLETPPRQWEIDLRSLGVQTKDDKAYNDYWKSYIPIIDGIDLDPGVTYSISFHFANGMNMASDTITFNDKNIVDVLLK